MAGNNKPRLGRGLGALIQSRPSAKPIYQTGRTDVMTVDEILTPASPNAPLATILPGIRVQEIALDLIDPSPVQPRSSMDSTALQELAESIRSHGILQPVLLKPIGERYQLLAGHRRTEAAKIATLKTVPALVRTDSTDESQVEWALIENIQRQDLNPIERARAYRNYIDRFHFTHQQASQRLGEDRTTISNYLRLLDLHVDVQHLVAGGKLSAGHAKVLAGISDPEWQVRLANLAIQDELSVRKLEVMSRQPPADATVAAVDAGGKKVKSPHIIEMEQDLSRKLGTKLRIAPARRKGTGKIIIQYFTLDDFDRIAEKLSV